MRAPVIIIGMHRSGTTLITDLLQHLGLFLGWVLQENAEALFFAERNEKLLNASGGDWEHPQPIDNLLQHAAMRQQAARVLRRDIESVRFISYLGPPHVRALGRLSRMSFPWGWKDPRNSFLLPLWLDVFPDARVVHISRHPMDVALSLQAREHRSLERDLARLSGRPWSEPSRTNAGVLRKDSGLLRLYRRVHGAQARLGGLRTYERLAVARSAHIEEGLALWASYTSRCLEHTNRLGERAMSLRFEDVLADPVPHVQQLGVFCGLPVDRAVVESLCHRIKTGRRFAYRSDPHACRAYEASGHRELARTLGY